MKAATYELKAGTSTSFCYQSGQQLLPKTLSISTRTGIGKVSRTGRGLLSKVGQMKAGFTRAENSPYKVNKPYRVQTSIWQVENYRTIYYGTIGITGETGRIEGDNGDLILFATADWKKLVVAVFVGLAEPKYLPRNLEAAAMYLKQTLQKK